jgi:hypothetical protein
MRGGTPNLSRKKGGVNKKLTQKALYDAQRPRRREGDVGEWQYDVTNLIVDSFDPLHVGD